MKILIDAHLSEDKITGIGRYLNGLICALSEQDKNDEIILLVSKNISQDHPLNKIHSHYVKKIEVPYQGPSLKQHFQIPRIVSMLKPDIYHHPHFDLPLYVNAPSIVTIHDLKYIQQPRFFPSKGKLKSTYMKYMLSSSVKRSQKIIAVSQFTKNDLVNLFQIPEEKVREELAECGVSGGAADAVLAATRVKSLDELEALLHGNQGEPWGRCALR